MVGGDVSDHAGERPDAQGGVVGDREMVLRLGAGRHPNVAARLSNDFISERREGPGEVPPGNIPRPSYGDELVPDEVETNEAWTLRVIEVAADGIPHVLLQSLERVRLGEDRRT